MEQRIPPQNVEAEQAVLGAMLLSHDAVIVAMEKLQSQDFYRDVHRIIFEAMEHLHRENKEIDVITLPDELKRMKKLDDVGGLEYVLNLPNLVGSAACLSTAIQRNAAPAGYGGPGRERKAENHRDAYSIQRGNCSDRHRYISPE